jgi:DNA-directed RNA polymerase alpha subunit
MKEKARLEERLLELSKDDKVKQALEIKAKIDEIEKEIEKEAQEENNLRIEKLGFSKETVDALRKIGIKTFGSLKNKTISWLSDMGLPKTHIDEVRNRLGAMGITVKYNETCGYPSSEECREQLLRNAAVAV